MKGSSNFMILDSEEPNTIKLFIKNIAILKMKTLKNSLFCFFNTILKKKTVIKNNAKEDYSTTSVLTATTLIYTIGAGITAGAGTRLVLQSFLLKLFTV